MVHYGNGRGGDGFQYEQDLSNECKLGGDADKLENPLAPAWSPHTLGVTTSASSSPGATRASGSTLLDREPGGATCRLAAGLETNFDGARE